MAGASSSKQDSLTGTKKKIKVHKRPSTESDNSSNDEEEYTNYLPPAARDSKWVGLTFYNPNFENSIGDEVTDEGEIRLMNLDEEGELPLFNLFPKLREQRKSQSVSLIEQSTTEITKSLVGQTPNFSHMKKNNKLNPMKLSLPSLKEIPNEEVEVKPTAVKSRSSTAKASHQDKIVALHRAVEQPSVSNTTSKDHYDEASDSKTDMQKRKKRWTKKRSDLGKNLESDSSYSAVNQPGNKQKENSIKPKSNHSRDKKVTIKHSSQGSFADDESGG